MPLIKSAKKKMRRDKQVQARNSLRRNTLKGLIKGARRTPDLKSLTATFSALDKAAKLNIIHPNKAARLKSRLSKKLSASA